MYLQKQSRLKAEQKKIATWKGPPADPSCSPSVAESRMVGNLYPPTLSKVLWEKYSAALNMGENDGSTFFSFHSLGPISRLID